MNQMRHHMSAFDPNSHGPAPGQLETNKGGRVGQLFPGREPPLLPGELAWLPQNKLKGCCLHGKLVSQLI